MDSKEIPGEQELYLSPEECRAWASKIRANKEHAFWGNTRGVNHTQEESDRALAFVNRLDDGWNSGKGFNLSGWTTEFEKEQEARMKDIHGPGYNEPKSSSNGIERSPDYPSEQVINFSDEIPREDQV